jgi:hypothetical protein
LILEDLTVAEIDTEERDDAVIGQAFRWSLAVVAGVAVMVGGVAFYLWATAKPAEVVTAAPVAPPQVREKPQLELPSIPFTDITESAGIRFRHESGAAGEKLLPETMGGGCAFLDYDGDGDQDLLFVNSCRWPWDTRPQPDPQPTMSLYQNDGTGRFTDVTHAVGLDVTFYGQGVAVGDYDRDGDPDLFFTAVGLNHLFRNDGGRFVSVTNDAGVGGDPAQWSTSCGWLDYDNDGDLDLFVGNYVVWTRQFDLDQDFQLTGGGRAYGRPQNFPGTYPYLYRNDGGGKFTEVGEAAGLHVKNPATGVPAAKSLGVTFADLDDDGFLDVIVANDTVQNFLFHNKQDGTFEEISTIAGVAFDNDGNARGAMGIDCARFRNSAHIGIAIGNFSNEMSALYVAHGPDLQFVDEAVATGFGPQTRLELKFATMFVDLDLDGRLDLIGANGHLEDEINRVIPSQFYEQPPHIFWNAGPEQSTEFVPLPVEKCGADYVKRMVGRGGAFADIDGDGDLDVVFVGSGRAPRLLRNEQQNGHHWLRLSLKGTRSNISAIGAQIEVRLPKQTLYSQVMPTRSYLSQVELPVTFGLGGATQAEQVRIRWPSGMVQTLEGVAADQTLQLTEPTAN